MCGVVGLLGEGRTGPLRTSCSNINCCSDNTAGAHQAPTGWRFVARDLQLAHPLTPERMTPVTLQEEAPAANRGGMSGSTRGRGGGGGWKGTGWAANPLNRVEGEVMQLSEAASSHLPYLTSLSERIKHSISSKHDSSMQHHRT